LGCGVGAAIPHLPDSSPEAVVVGIDRTQPTVALSLAPSRCSPLLVGDAGSVPGSLVNPHRLHAMAVGAASCERSCDIV
jgi:hypothetical protein